MKRLVNILIIFCLFGQFAYCNDFYSGFTVFDTRAHRYKPNFETLTIDQESAEIFNLYNIETWPTMREMIEQYIKKHGTSGNSTNLLRTAIADLKEIQKFQFPESVKCVLVFFKTDGIDNTLGTAAHKQALENVRNEVAKAAANDIPIITYVIEVRPNNSSYTDPRRQGLAELEALSGNDPSRFFKLPDFRDENSALNQMLDQVSATQGEYACYFVIDKSPSLAGAGNDIEFALNTIREKVLMKPDEGKNEFVTIPSGEFIMGSNNHDADEAPAHKRIIESFRLGVTPVTEAQYYAVMGPSERAERYRNSSKPITGISYSDAVRYCIKRSEAEGKRPVYKFQDDGTVIRIAGANGYYLPSEAQYQYAASAGTANLYHTGQTLSKDDINISGELMDVGMFQPNPWGLQDITGCVRQWTSDFYDVYRPETDFTPPAKGATMVCYGASFRDKDKVDRYRITYRFHHDPDFSDEYLGFRIAIPE